MIKIVFLSENKTGHSHILAEHGLSVYVETGDKKILFDAGASKELYRKNAHRLGIKLEDVDFAAVSHGHYDHTNGFPTFIEINKKAPIYIHEKAFGEVYGSEDGKIDDHPCSIEWTNEEREALAPRLSLTKGPLWISKDIVVSGTVEIPKGCEMSEVFYEKLADGTFIKDEMEHEQILVIRDRDERGESKGLYIFAGCCHRGVLAAIECAKSLFPGERIACLLAGMHLFASSKETRDRVINQVIENAPDIVMPVHCTGINSICDIKSRLGEACIVATAGDVYEF